jgi:hypothetical protein
MLSYLNADLGPGEDELVTKASWHEEIEGRLEDVQEGRVDTIPAAKAKRMIRDGERPSV